MFARSGGWLLAAILSATGAVFQVNTVLATPEETPPKGLYTVKVVHNIAYYDGPDADPVKHRLDLYMPEGKTDAPVLFFVHGGAWTIGDKNQFGIPERLGKALARHGLGLVSINYRLSPKVKHPDHIRDVARAFAWTYQKIGAHGGCKEEIFACGHSAGGHLVALLGTDEQYLREHDLGLNALRGVIPISGVFHLTSHQVFTSVFGTSPAGLSQASPLSHARPDAPPFLILYASDDLPGCGKPFAHEFYLAMKAKKARVQIQEIEKRNHLTIWLNSAEESDPAYQSITSFMVAHATLHRLSASGPAGLALLGRYLLSNLPGE
jgi:acetyl esterase/lipase